MRKLSILLLISVLVCLSFGTSISLVAAADGVQLTKVASSDNATLGDTIVYTYTIINSTTENCFEAKLVDNKIGEIAIPDQLLAGDNITTTASYVVTMTDYSDNATELVNIATFTGSENITATATERVALNPYKASLQVFKEASRDSAAVGDTITYTYKVVNNGLVDITKLALSDDKLGAIPLLGDNGTILSLAPGESATASASYKIVFSDLLGGTIKNTATVTGVDPDGRPVSGISSEVVVSTDVVKSLLTKYQVLKLSGVPGKGIENAPGLQKPFNPNSQAGEHAGKKDGNGNTENTNQEMNNNQGKGNGHGKNK